MAHLRNRFAADVNLLGRNVDTAKNNAQQLVVALTDVNNKLSGAELFLKG
jgi:hypothetical protein